MTKRTKSNRRPQTSKANREMALAFQELRRGSRTSPIPSGKVYRRPAPGSKEF